MKKYAKIIFKSKEMPPIHLSLEKWSAILESDKMIIPYLLDTETEWSGKVFNKLEVAGSDYDDEYTKKANEPKYHYYRQKSTNVIKQMLEGELPDNLDDYERVS
jgi:hypothetical protein